MSGSGPARGTGKRRAAMGTSSGVPDESSAEDWYRRVLGTVDGLRRGFTTGSCAQAAAKAAVIMLSTGDPIRSVRITLPRSNGRFSERSITVPLEEAECGGASATAAVRKDAGDDPDDTHGLLFLCTARWSETPGVSITAGRGLGVVTKEGLAVSPGEPAVNPVPRRMIRQEVEPLLGGHAGVDLTFEVPEGEEVARSTWNPRLGIEGGVSIIGTTGVVEPKSSKAFQSSLASFIHTAVVQGRRRLVIASGYVGEGYLERRLGVPGRYIVTVGDHFGFALDQCVKQGCNAVYIVGHIGKLVKLAAGIFNTHNMYGDARLETLAALAAAEGADQRLVEELLSQELAETAVGLLRENGLSSVFSRLAVRLRKRVHSRCGEKLEVGVVLLDLKGESLAAIPKRFTEEGGWESCLS